MSEHVTTNIRLPKELHRALKRRAAAEDKSLAEILREAAARYLAELKTPRDVEDPDDQYHRIAVDARDRTLKQYRWITTNWIVWETVTWLRRHIGHQRAVQFGERLTAPVSQSCRNSG